MSELKKLKQEIKDLYSGRSGACHTCEQVAELNIKLEQENEKLRECIDYLWEKEPDKTEMLDILQKTLKELEK